jgi:Zn-dependent protease with chaperone function
MNFFREQQRAQRRTALLVAYFILAVTLIIVAVNIAAAWVFGAVLKQMHTRPAALTWDWAEHPFVNWLHSPYWVWASLATLAVILIGTIRTSLTLATGGRAVAEMVGARRIHGDSQDPDERKLINVVEEMSIASGTPAPRLYAMDEEPGINAFVAGFRPTEAVLVVTAGTLRKLSRDELQGVVAHEYSHILHGDMRLNVRLWAVLSGILLIGKIGEFLMRAAGRSSHRGSGRRGGGGAQLFLIGLALFVIGYIGLFFGRLIKAAVSRQREFLADASAVQFTRQPAGLAGALWKIGQDANGARLASVHAEDMSHMCFGQGLDYFFSLMATHPPIEARIKAVDPIFSARRIGERFKAEAEERRATPAAPAATLLPTAAIAMTAGAAAAAVGNVTPAHVDYAAALHAAIPPALLDALHGGETAPTAVTALLLAGLDAMARRTAINHLVENAGAETAAAAEALIEPIARLGPRARLSLFNIALPALKALAPAARAAIIDRIDALARSDQKVSLFEFVLLTLLREHLREDADRLIKPRYYTHDAVLPEIRLLLSVIARAGAASPDQARSAYGRGMVLFDRDTGGEPLPAGECKPAALTAALQKLAALAPILKQSVITACADCILHDGKATVAEAELMQAIAETLDCPMPPLLAAA